MDKGESSDSTRWQISIGHVVRLDVEDGQGASSDSTQWQMSIGYVVRFDVA